MHVIDLNGDGRNDVLTTSAHSYGLCWFEQRDGGEWRQHIIDHSWSHLHASVLAAVDGDGRPDLVLPLETFRCTAVLFASIGVMRGPLNSYGLAHPE